LKHTAWKLLVVTYLQTGKTASWREEQTRLGTPSWHKLDTCSGMHAVGTLLLTSLLQQKGQPPQNWGYPQKDDEQKE